MYSFLKNKAMKESKNKEWLIYVYDWMQTRVVQKWSGG